MVNSRTKGRSAEQAVARYFRDHISPESRRVVAAGWSNGRTSGADLGDVHAPGLCIQVKSLARPLAGKLLADTWRETQAQTAALAAHTGRTANSLIVEKRPGSADVGRWWVHLSSRVYVALVTGAPRFVASDHLVRVELGDITQDLRLWCRER